MKNDPNTSSNSLPNNVSLLEVEIGVKAGSGSLPIDKVTRKCCRICQRNGYPHEPIFWGEIRQYNQENATVNIVAVPFDYFKPSIQHIHKIRRTW